MSIFIVTCCVISYFYIKPQHLLGGLVNQICCVISYFYIKPQPDLTKAKAISSCVISYFYIKPQQEIYQAEINGSCVISYFYIKPQLRDSLDFWHLGCVISYFYIKPQQMSINNIVYSGCVISYFYIKPQLFRNNIFCISVVLYLTSTSNHNPAPAKVPRGELCYILLLHQTTTMYLVASVTLGCVISYFYIKPQPTMSAQLSSVSCVISYFYIKPQLTSDSNGQFLVVLYLTSTSNHNSRLMHGFNVLLCYILLLHQTTTGSKHP